MFEQLLAITRNTFLESIRQPIMLVMLLIATILLIAANPLAAFTMENDQRMLLDMGLATIFICGTLLAAFIATNVLGREIENRTALTVISKPVGRPMFVVGKFLGVGLALSVATVYMSVVFGLVELSDVVQTARDEVHSPSWVFGGAAVVLGLAIGVWCNYFYNWVFSSTTIIATIPMVAFAYLLAMKFDGEFRLRPLSDAFEPQLWAGMAGLLLAILVLTSIALAASTRFKQVMTLTITLLAFMLGMLSDWLFGRYISKVEAAWLVRAKAAGQTEAVEQTVQEIIRTNGEVTVVTQTVDVPTVALSSLAEGSEQLAVLGCRIAHTIFPNFQVFFLSDALTQEHVIPADYLPRVAVYAALYIIAMLALATVLFQRREVG